MLRTLPCRLLIAALVLLPATARAASTGERHPTATTAVGSGFNNPTNALACDGVSADAKNNRVQDYHVYGFAIPGGATITGVEVRVRATDTTASTHRLEASLSWDGGTTFTAVKQTAPFPANAPLTDYLLGGPSDLWGHAWTDAEFSNANFRLRVDSVLGSPVNPDYLDCIPVTVYYTAPAATATNTVPPTTTSTSTATATPTNTDTPPPTSTAVATSTETSTPLPTATATATDTPQPTSTHTPPPTDTASPEPTATATDTPEPTSTDTPDPTATDTASPEPSATATDTPEPPSTDTPDPTATDTASPEPTATTTDTPEPTSTDTAGPTATDTASPEPTATATDTPEPTSTDTAGPTATDTPSPEPTATATDTPTPTATATPLPACGDGRLDAGEECDDGNTAGVDGCDAGCRVEACHGCSGEPSVCTPRPPLTACRHTTIVGGSILGLKDDAANRKDKVVWKLRGVEATSKGDFGSPTIGTDYSFCLYDQIGGSDVIALWHRVPAGDNWIEQRRGFKYTDPSLSKDGIRSIRLKAGAAGRAKVRIYGAGQGLGVARAGLPLDQSSQVTAQLSNGSTCWEAVFTTSRRNSSKRFKAVSDQ